MNKDEMIKDMKQIIKGAIDETIQYYVAPANDKEAEIEATALYNANCRIIGEDEQVVKTEQLHETLNSTCESGKRMGYAQGRDETAREILKEIKKEIEDIGDWQPVYDEMFARIAKKNGIELE